MSFSKSISIFIGSAVVFGAIFAALYTIFRGSINVILTEIVIFSIWFALGLVVLKSHCKK